MIVEVISKKNIAVKILYKLNNLNDSKSFIKDCCKFWVFKITNPENVILYPSCVRNYLNLEYLDVAR